MADAIVGPLLSKLQEVAVNEGKALAGVGDEIDRLRERLMWLHALVHETDLRCRSEGNQFVRVLARQLREITFEAEDAVDHFVLKVDLSRFSRHWRRAARLFLANFATQIRIRYNLSRKIKSMSARLDDIHDNSAKYSSNNESTGAPITWRASRHIPPVRHNWDDMDLEESREPNKKKKEQLTDLVNMEKSGDHVIYVVGESGIGKRHLVKKVCENETIKEKFAVCISESFPPDTSSSIADKIKGRLEAEWNKLEAEGRNMDKVFNYLVVVDCTMSSTTLGKSIVEKLPKSDKVSKIVLTATSSPPDKNDDTIEVGYLVKKESKTLFNKSLGLRGRRRSAYKIEMMDKVRNVIEVLTNGLPLAVILLAKLMRTMPYSKWEAAAEYIKDNNQHDPLKTIVSMGIDDLPDELKSCLLYMAAFPDRSTIDARQLVRLWIGEGFLTQQLGVEPEELGQRYLKELIFRGLVQLVEKKEGNVESVAIRDQIHQFFRWEAQRTGFMETYYGMSAAVPDSARRLTLNSRKLPKPDKMKELKKLRTLLSFHDGHNYDGKGPQSFKEVFPELLTNSTFLRVISLECIDIGKELPREISNMLHLQYLGVRCPTLRTVPRSIGKLKKLQIMDVRGTNVRTLPDSFWKIKSLRRVVCDNDLTFPAENLMLIMTSPTSDENLMDIALGMSASETLPVDTDAFAILVRTLGSCWRKKSNKAVEQELIEGSGGNAASATWEDRQELQDHFPAAPAWGQAGSQEGRDVRYPSGQETPETPPIHHGDDLGAEVARDGPLSDEDSESFEDQIDDDVRIKFSQRVRLNKYEKNHLVQLLPSVGAYIGVLFVTRFTRTNLNTHDMKLSKVIAEEAGIPAEGNAGLRLGTAGAVVIITYNKTTDGRIDFDKLGWRNFMEGKNFVIGQPVLIILRKTNELSLKVMIELQLIKN